LLWQHQQQWTIAI